MAFNLGPFEVDELSWFLAGLSLVIYLYYRWNVFTPDIHGSFLNCQSNTSPTRLPEESPIYRHRSVPFSIELSYRISREISTVSQLISKALEEKC
ncbi:medium-chain fatty acid-CoA ligase faa2 [Entomophthora muscae]|uniref:Medium-chain fatty acid-CoA ligase faa2 n=1 Tax=Entomophthora muscae TaxID=34485 RepID=A0ACC2UG81_9FUNG|nr:medium-chain fatty acid-CoA ligase faa2 [Entomophthora muscae]